MKVYVTFKDPDAFFLTNQNCNRNPKFDSETLIKLKEKYFPWGEYVTIELDMETMEARVCEA